MSSMTATYSPEDNKLRLYTVSRLDQETYEKVKAAGFRWAAKQELWVAPMWTPERADLLVDMCGEIEDEDKSLIERAEERAERFEEYGEKRAEDAEGARQAVDRIANGIPLGQPILVGHHSEKKARKDAERIENGMRKAVQMWETSKYWVTRAKGAIQHAKYKERPDVRHRRIKGLESDKRKQEKAISDAETFIKLWSKEGLTYDSAMNIANYDHISLPVTESKPYGESLWSALDGERITTEAATKLALERHATNIKHARRWLAHIENRIVYERAMLGETGDMIADKFPIEVGGRVLCGGWKKRFGYLVVLRVNKAGGVINSVSTTEGVVSVEDVKDYHVPEAGEVEKVKAAKKLPPLVNYPGEGFRHMLKEEYEKRSKHSDFYRARRVEATDKHGVHRRREAPREGGQYYQMVGVYLTDAKRVDPPAPEVAKSVKFEHQPAPLEAPRAPRQAPERTVFDDMKDSLKAGVAVVSAPQLFPTPPELAARMVRMAGVEAHHHVLEPSVGTARIYDAVRAVVPMGLQVVAVEINPKLAKATGAICADFLTLTAERLGGLFDRIVMNPPFADGQDVAHVMHAFEMLAEGGTLVSVMSAGVKWREDKKTAAFRVLIKEYGELEDLPDDTFASAGTSVRTVLVTLRK